MMQISGTLKKMLQIYLAKNIQGPTVTFVIVKYKLDEPILDTPRIILFITPQLQKGPKDFLQKAEVTSNQACHLYE